MRRLRTLSQVCSACKRLHGVGEFLLNLAGPIRLKHYEVTWISTQQCSQQGAMPLEGRAGEVWDPAPVDLPALWLDSGHTSAKRRCGEMNGTRWRHSKRRCM